PRRQARAPPGSAPPRPRGPPKHAPASPRGARAPRPPTRQPGQTLGEGLRPRPPPGGRLFSALGSRPPPSSRLADGGARRGGARGGPWGPRIEAPWHRSRPRPAPPGPVPAERQSAVVALLSGRIPAAVPVGGRGAGAGAGPRLQPPRPEAGGASACRPA